MTYTTLVAAKAVTGSIIGWVGYGRLDVQTILDEAQSLIYQSLRVREMRTEWMFGMPVGGSRAALPARFLDPIGSLLSPTTGQKYRHLTESTVCEGRSFDSSPAGSFGANPFTTGAANSANVTAAIPGHGLTQGSDITISGANATLDGVGLNGTFPVVSIPDANTIIFQSNDVATAGGVNGGGSAATYTANLLIAGFPSSWAIWDECLQFDAAFDTASQFRIGCYKSLPLLSATNQSNFLTNRFPLLVRKACMAAAADFMKDDTEYEKQLKALELLIQNTNAESDLGYRGADLYTETP